MRRRLALHALLTPRDELPGVHAREAAEEEGVPLRSPPKKPAGMSSISGPMSCASGAKGG